MIKKILLLSAYAESDSHSGSNRLRKLRAGLQEAGTSVDWIGPKSGYITHGKWKKIIAIWQLVLGAGCWAVQNPGSVILISLPPPWMSIVSAFVGIFWGKRIVLDFRDPLLNQSINPRGTIFSGGMKAIQSFILNHCFAVIVAANGIEPFLYPCKRPIQPILAGYEPLSAKRNPWNGEKIKVIYGGSFYASRNPDTLFSVINDIDPQFEFHFYINFASKEDEEKIKANIEKLGIGTRVMFYPPIAHQEFMEKLMDADIGLVITHGTGSEYAIPGKIYDYLAAACLPWIISSDKALLDFVAKYKIPSVTSNWGDGSALVADTVKLQKLLLKKEEASNTAIAELSNQNQAALLLAFLSRLQKS